MSINRVCVTLKKNYRIALTTVVRSPNDTHKTVNVTDTIFSKCCRPSRKQRPHWEHSLHCKSQNTMQSDIFAATNSSGTRAVCSNILGKIF